MFTYAFVSGVKNGWLPEDTYGPAARKAWIALVGYLTPEGDLREVCVGTGKKNDSCSTTSIVRASWVMPMARRRCCGPPPPC